MSQGLVCRRCRKYILSTESWGFHESCAQEEFATYLQEIQELRAEVERLKEEIDGLRRTGEIDRDSLTGKEDEIARLGEKLCKVKEWCDKHGFDEPTNMNRVQPVIRGLLEFPSPCPHEEQEKITQGRLCRLRSEVDKAIHVLKVRMKSDGIPRDFTVEDLERSRYSDTPCSHKARLKELERALRGGLQQQRLNGEKNDGRS